jgi:hypothetical protein
MEGIASVGTRGGCILRGDDLVGSTMDGLIRLDLLEHEDAFDFDHPAGRRP